jgi:hypothetical protein
MASRASWKAVVPLAQAFSTVTIGMPVRPSPERARWATPGAPKTVPT